MQIVLKNVIKTLSLTRDYEMEFSDILNKIQDFLPLVPDFKDARLVEEIKKSEYLAFKEEVKGLRQLPGLDKRIVRLTTSGIDKYCKKVKILNYM